MYVNRREKNYLLLNTYVVDDEMMIIRVQNIYTLVW